MITEKTLRRWRKDSLNPTYNANPDETISAIPVSHITELHERILRMTQDLLDQHLIRKDR